DEVVGRQRIVEVGAGHLQDRRAQAAQRRHGLLESGQDTRLVALTAEFLYHRYPYSGEVGPGPLACCHGDGRHALWDRGRIARIVPPHHLVQQRRDRKSTRLNSSHDQISYAVFCLKKKKNTVTLRFLLKKKYNGGLLR